MEAAASLPPLCVAVAGAENALPLDSAREATRLGLIEPILVGDPEAIKARAKDAGWELGATRVVAAVGEKAAAETAVALVRKGEASALMKGHVHTDVLMAAVLDRQNGLRTGRRLSHVFHMTTPGSKRELMITDAAVNIAPDLDTKFDIVRNVVDFAHAMGMAAPRVALLSGTEDPHSRMPSAADAAKLTERCAGTVAGAQIFGPLAFDNAVSPEAARIKGIDNPVAGHADVIVVPNIETGNAMFKMMVHFMGATAAGLVLGAAAPIILTSRADPPEARVAAAAIAAITSAVAERRGVS